MQSYCIFCIYTIFYTVKAYIITIKNKQTNKTLYRYTPFVAEVKASAASNDIYQKFPEDMAVFSRTYVLYLQEYIDEICSELTTFAVESPTDGVYFINEVKRAEEKIVVKKSISVNFRLILQYENIKHNSLLPA